MIKLSEKNIPSYLQSLGIFKRVDWKKVVVFEITKHTNVNFVFCVKLNSSRYKKIYLKQAFDFVKVAPDFPAPIERQFFEKESIDYLQSFWEGRIPKVIHYDQSNHALVITDIGQGAKLLADEIEQGKLHLEIGADLGRMMAELHAATFGLPSYPVRDKKANQEHIDFIFGFRLKGSREILPKETNLLFSKSLQVKTAMTYGDWASKNVLVFGKKVRLVDFENLAKFDPAFDIGYALSHWVLEISEKNQNRISRFFLDFERDYLKSWPDSLEEEVGGILKRASNYTGAMMLHRLAGVKNTNRLEKYLSGDIPLEEVAKKYLLGSYASPSAATKTIKL